VFTSVVIFLSSGSSLPGPRPQLVRVLLPPARRGVVPFPFSPGASRGDEEEKNPNGVGGLASAIRLPGALLKRGHGQPGVDCPQCPWTFAGLGRWRRGRRSVTPQMRVVWG
jgi:hypothetical protein